MSEAVQAVRGFLEGWKPYAVLPPGNPARRSIHRFVETDDVAERTRIIARCNLLFQLHELYQGLGMLREQPDANMARFAQLISMPAEEMAEAIAGEGRRPFLEMLQAAFEFGRSPLEPRLAAVRRFLLDLWSLTVEGMGMKYSLYANGVLFAAGGLTHDQMARRFNELGFGQAWPMGGGEFQRLDTLAFAFDTDSTAFGKQLKPEFVKISLSRWVHQTGGREEELKLTVRNKPGA